MISVVVPVLGAAFLLAALALYGLGDAAAAVALVLGPVVALGSGWLAGYRRRRADFGARLAHWFAADGAKHPAWQYGARVCATCRWVVDDVCPCAEHHEVWDLASWQGRLAYEAGIAGWRRFRGQGQLTRSAPTDWGLLSVILGTMAFGAATALGGLALLDWPAASIGMLALGLLGMVPAVLLIVPRLPSETRCLPDTPSGPGQMGTIRAAGAPVFTPITGTESAAFVVIALAVHGGATALRQAYSAELVVELDSGAAVHVPRGPISIDVPVLYHRTAVPSRLARAWMESRCAHACDLVHEIILRDGDRVEVFGELVPAPHVSAGDDAPYRGSSAPALTHVGVPVLRVG